LLETAKPITTRKSKADPRHMLKNPWRAILEQTSRYACTRCPSVPIAVSWKSP